MSGSENGFVRLPPDSTGKKSGAAGRLIIDFTGEAESPEFQIGQTVTGGSSNATGRITGITRDGFTDGEGQLFIDVDSVENGPFSLGENLLVGVTTYAQIKGAADLNEIYYQKDVIVDRDNPNRALTLDDRGAANVRFTDGQPSLSTFGGLIVDGPESVRHYVYAYDGLDDRFYSVTSGSGDITYLPNERSVLFDTNGTASGDLSQRTSHFYHPYQPGSMLRIMQTIVLGDSGKDGVRRRWGYFDDNNGLYWELRGTELCVVNRSNTEGTVTEDAVTQSDWNRDKLDGSTRFDIDVTKTNLYWIDFQWLGVGLARFGVYEDDGTKTVAHVFENPNNQIKPYMRQGTLPIRFECENTGVAVSSSELKSTCTSVQNVGHTKRQLNSKSICTSSPRTISSASGEVPILSLRPATTYNGLPNHTVALVSNVNVYNSNAKNLLVRWRRGSVLLGDSFTGITNSPVEYDENGTGFLFQGEEIFASFVPSGESFTYDFLRTADDYQDDVGILLLADEVTQPANTLTCKVIDGDPSDISVAVTWKEVIM